MSRRKSNRKRQLELDRELDEYFEDFKRRKEEITHVEELLHDVPQINSIDDLIAMSESGLKYKSINNAKLHNILPALKKLQDMKGIDEIKSTILGQILYYMQELDRNDDDYMHTVITGGPGTGKCLGKDTPILMFDGSVKPVQMVKPGDLLMGDDSNPRTVLNISTGRETLYRVKQPGNDYIVNESHILSLKYNGKIIDISVRDYLAADWRDKARGYKTDVSFPERPVPYHPYLVGLCIDIAYIDDEVKEKVNQIYANIGQTAPAGNYFHIKGLNLAEIPQEYKINSEKNRLELLAGIIDNEGFLSYNKFTILGKTRRMAEDIAFLARSLGFAAELSNDARRGELWRITIRGDLSRIPVACARKQTQQITEDVLSYPITVEKLDQGDYYGFEITGNRRFLLGDFTVTHNTTLSEILAEIYCHLGRISTGKVHNVKRSDLIGKWCGHTANMTLEAVKQARGGVLRIDEAYNIGGSPGHVDTFAKECVDTLNQCLSEYKKDFICIIVGYKDSLDKCFFNINKGLERRFSWHHDMGEAPYDILGDIFRGQADRAGWTVDPDAIPPGFFVANKALFENGGGATEVLLSKCKIAHAIRVFGTDSADKSIINRADFMAGFQKYKLNKKEKEDNKPPMSMYL